jgi:hypothetical protein
MWISLCGINRLLTQHTNKNLGYLKPNTAAGKTKKKNGKNLKILEAAIGEVSLVL